MLRSRSLATALFMALAFATRHARRIVVCSLLPMVVASGFCAAQPVEARDRPGTPNQEALDFCGFKAYGYKPWLCGHFNNTATEEITVEMEMTRNGAPYAFDPNALDCNHIGGVKVPNGTETPVGHNVYPYNEPYHVVMNGECYHPGSTIKRPANDPPGYPYMFEGVVADFSTQYCARFRARRVSDQVVSERWSNYACVQTPPRPAAVPSRPDFTVSFSGSQAYLQDSGTATAAVGETAKVIPAKLTITTTDSSSNAVEYKITMDPDLVHGSSPNPFASWRVDDPGYKSTHVVSLGILPAQGAIGLSLCAYNAAGQSCNHKVISVLGQSTEIHQMPAAHIPLPTSTPTISPFGVKAGTNQVSRGLPIMVGIDLPGNDYSSKPISGTAIDCQTACGLDDKCVAWTWVKPGVQNTQAMCWLKNSVPAAKTNVNATSGVKSRAVVH